MQRRDGGNKADQPSALELQVARTYCDLILKDPDHNKALYALGVAVRSRLPQDEIVRIAIQVIRVAWSQFRRRL
jgi:galactose-1-phosphate uridylyltransferase